MRRRDLEARVLVVVCGSGITSALEADAEAALLGLPLPLGTVSSLALVSSELCSKTLVALLPLDVTLAVFGLPTLLLLLVVLCGGVHPSLAPSGWEGHGVLLRGERGRSLGT